MQLGNLARGARAWLRARHGAVSDGGLAHGRLLAIALLRHDRGAARVGVPVHALDGGKQLGVDGLHAGAIYSLNRALNLTLVYLFECIEGVV